MKYQSFLIKYAEIGIKGKNRHIFEEALVRQIKHALKPCEGNFAVQTLPFTGPTEEFLWSACRTMTTARSPKP